MQRSLCQFHLVLWAEWIKLVAYEAVVKTLML